MSRQYDVVLVNPYSTRENEYGIFASMGVPRPPLNLLNIGATLIKSGFRVRLVDGALFHDPERLLEEILACEPRIVAFTAMTAYIHTANDIAEEIKRRLSGVITIIGGIHVSTYPEATLRDFTNFSFGVVGEGDFSIVESVRAALAGRELRDIKGLVVRHGADIILTPRRERIANLDILPFPAWELMPNYVTDYQPTVVRGGRYPSAYLVTSRGCPFACTFCNNVHGRTFRSYSVAYIIGMIDKLIELYGVKDITIYDENLAYDKERITGLCNELIDRKYDLTWSCDARVNSVTDDALSLMRRAGCHTIWFGIESGNPSILKRYKKGITIEQVENAVKITQKNDIKAVGSFIIGGPKESVETIKETLRFAKKLKLDSFVPLLYTPIPGTTDYDTILEEGTADLDYRHATMTRVTFAPLGMTFVQVQRWFVWSIFSWSLQPRIIRGLVASMGLRRFISGGFSFFIKAISSVFKSFL